MEKDIKVSVLIPVYGVEKYIEKSARSLFEQTMQEGIEFIFTDDCTKDRSIEIVKEVLKEYPHRQSQVRFLRHKENMGLAEARVTGLNASRGEYVIHCDSDDWVDPKMYELLYKEAKKTDADIVGCDAIHVFKNEQRVRKEAFNLDQTQLVKEMILGKALEGYLWNRLIRRSFYIKGGFRAEKGTTMLEDMAVTVPMHALSDRVGYVAQPLYFYRRTDIDSMSGAMSDKNIASAISVLDKLKTIPMQQIWIDAIDSRLKSFLFLRILAFRDRDADGWRRIESPFINTHEIRLSPSQNIAKFLGEKQLDHSLYCFMIANKLLDPIVWYYRLKRYIRIVKGK